MVIIAVIVAALGLMGLVSWATYPAWWEQSFLVGLLGNAVIAAAESVVVGVIIGAIQRRRASAQVTYSQRDIIIRVLSALVPASTVRSARGIPITRPSGC